MVTVELSFEQARALRGLLNITNKNKGTIKANSVEDQAAAEIGMESDELEGLVYRVWKLLDNRLKEEWS